MFYEMMDRDITPTPPAPPTGERVCYYWADKGETLKVMTCIPNFSGGAEPNRILTVEPGVCIRTELVR